MLAAQWLGSEGKLAPNYSVKWTAANRYGIFMLTRGSGHLPQALEVMTSSSKWLGLAMLVASIGAFAYDWLLGIRVIGACELLFGLQLLRTRRILYGLAGQPASGVLTGRAAILASLLAIALGCLFIAAPQFAMPFFCSSRTHNQYCP